MYVFVDKAMFLTPRAMSFQPSHNCTVANKVRPTNRNLELETNFTSDHAECARIPISRNSFNP